VTETQLGSNPARVQHFNYRKSTTGIGSSMKSQKINHDTDRLSITKATGLLGCLPDIFIISGNFSKKHLLLIKQLLLPAKLMATGRHISQPMQFKVQWPCFQAGTYLPALSYNTKGHANDSNL